MFNHGGVWFNHNRVKFKTGKILLNIGQTQQSITQCCLILV